LIKVLVILHHKENRKKCTLTPLRRRAELEVKVIRPAPGGYQPLEIEGGVLLQVGAPPLGPDDRALLDEDPCRRLVLIDSNWIKVPAILRSIRSRGPLARRSLPSEVRTAYPRRSKLFRDPPGGLATVEAIAAANAILGEFDPSFLENYHWAGEFLELNRDLFSVK